MPTQPGETRESLKRKAAHARRLATGVAGNQAKKRLIDYAEELEARASPPADHPDVGEDDR